MGRVGRGEGLGREKSLTDGVGHGVDDVLDAVSLLGGDVEAYPCFRFPIARVKTPNLRIGRRRRSGVAPFLKAPPWACGKFAMWCVFSGGVVVSPVGVVVLLACILPMV